jgi:hypothetical protein
MTFPQFKRAVVRAWAHDYGGPDGVAELVTVWDEEQGGFFDYCVNSGDSFWGGVAFEDASEAVLSRWQAVPGERRSVEPPERQPARGELLGKRYA